MTKVFIDTNIYLNFYRLSSQSLSSLSLLQDLIKKEKIELILPKQVKDEFYREKEVVANQFSEKLKQIKKVEIKEPLFLKSYPKVKKLKGVVHKLNVIAEDIIKEYKRRITNSKSKINKNLNTLFSKALEPEENNDILNRAYFRTLRGNPPRKNNKSFGDAIIWETILSADYKDDLFIVSYDGDFASEVYKTKINEFLYQEWQQKTKKNLKLYTNLGEFINDFTRKKIIKKEIIEQEKSSNFQSIQNIYPIISGVSQGTILASGVINPSANQVVLNDSILTNTAKISTNGLFVKPDNVVNINEVICSFCSKPYSDLSGVHNPISGLNICPDCINKYGTT